MFKLSEQKLIEFSKSANAWEIVYSALQEPNLSPHHYFHAATILKNKLKIDIISIRDQPSPPQTTDHQNGQIKSTLPINQNEEQQLLAAKSGGQHDNINNDAAV